MKKVFWTIPDYGSPELQIVFSEPESLFKHLQQTRKGTAYLKCPAFQDYVKNVFIIKAPLDVEITINRKTGTLNVTGIPEEYGKFIINRIDQFEPTNPYVMSAFPVYIFYSNDNIMMESMPPFMETNDSIINTMMIPGVYNISKWIRTIDFSFEVKDDTQKIKIKRGDVLFYVKFRTDDESKVELERVAMTEELNSVEKSCSRLKLAIKNVPLKTLYSMAESFIKTLSFRKPKKCPFGFSKK